MTVSTTESVVEYISGGPAFPIPYRFLQDSDIQAVLVDQVGNAETLVLGTQYTLSGAGTQNGGTLTSAYAASVLATPGGSLTISRVMIPVQPTDLRNQGRFLAETHEFVFDRLTMLVQQGIALASRALLRPWGKNYYDAQGRQIKNLGAPTIPGDATNKKYVDDQNNAQDMRIDALSAGLPGTNYAFPWSTTTTQSTKTLTPGFTFASATLYLNGIAQPYGKAFAVVANQIVLAEAIPEGTEVYAILGQSVVPTPPTENAFDLYDYAALRAYTGPAQVVHITKAGVEGFFYLDPLSSLTDDGGVTIVDVGGRVWRRLLGSFVDPKWYGLVSGSTSDGAPAIQSAVNAAKSLGIHVSTSGSFSLLTTVTARNVGLDLGNAQFTLRTPDQIGFIIGGSSSLGWAPRQEIGTCLRQDGTRDTPCIRVAGTKGGFFEIGRTTHLQVYASTTLSTDGSIAYSQFKGGQWDKLSLDTDPANAGGDTSGGIGSSVQWINENMFYVSRCFEFYMGGSYRHNHNRFYGLTLENSATFNMQAGNKNRFYNLRFEAGPTTIIFGVETANNRLMNSWDPGNDDTPSSIVSGSIVDLGVANVVYDDFGECRNTACVASADISDPLVGNRSGELISRQPHLQRVGGSGGNQPMCYSDMLPIERNLFFYFLYGGADTGDTVLYRPLLEFYDKNLVPINAVASWITGNAITTVSGNQISTSAGQPFSYATVLQSALDAGAAYMRVAIRVSSSQTANALARQLKIFASYAHGSQYQAAAYQQQYRKTVVTTAPTSGYVPVGHEVTLNTGASFYICTFAFETTLTAAAASGATALTIAAGTGVAIGDRVGVNMDNRDTHWTTVSAISGTSLTLTAGLTAASASGSRVVFNRQVTK